MTIHVHLHASDGFHQGVKVQAISGPHLGAKGTIQSIKGDQAVVRWLSGHIDSIPVSDLKESNWKLIRDAEGEVSVTWSTFLRNIQSGKWVYSGTPDRRQGTYFVTVPEKGRGVHNSANRTLRVTVPMTPAEIRANEEREAEQRLLAARAIRERQKQNTGDAKWTGTYEAVVKGKKKSISATVEAPDAYEAGDRLRQKFEERYGTDFIHPVAKFQGGPKRLDPGSVSRHIASKAGPEED